MYTFTPFKKLVIMKKVWLMVALAAISFGSVFAHGTTRVAHPAMQTDTVKKEKKKGMKTKKKKMVKKDTTSMSSPAK